MSVFGSGFGVRGRQVAQFRLRDSGIGWLVVRFGD